MDVFLRIFDMMVPIRSVIAEPNPNNIAMLVFFLSIVFLAWYFIRKYFCVELKTIKQELIHIHTVLGAYTQETVQFEYEQLNESLQASGLARSSWREFDKTIVKVQKREGGHHLYSTTDASCFFNEDILISSRTNLDLLNAVPGFFTGLGILGTFLGLTIGLGQVDLGSADVEVMKQGIKVLLSGMGTAFATSLWGLFLALPFSYFAKRDINALRQLVEQIQDQLDSLFIRKPAESWLAESLEEARQQTRELKSFNSDLGMAIGEALEIKLNQSFGPTFERLLQAITDLSQAGVAKVAESISDGAGKELESFGRTLQQVQESMRVSIEASQTVSQQMTETFEDKLKKTSDNLAGLLESAALRQQQVGEQTNQKLFDMLSAMEQSLSTTQERLQVSTVQSSQTMASSLQTASDTIVKVSADYGQLIQRQGTALEDQTREMSNLLRNVIGDMSKAYDGSASGMKATIGQMEAILRETRAVIANIANAAQTFGVAAEPVRAGVKELEASLRTLSTVQQNFIATTADSQQKLGTSALTVQQSMESTRQILGETRNAWGSYQQQFGLLRGDLEAVFGELEKGLKNYQSYTREGIQDYLSGLDGHLSKALSSLAGVVEDLGEAADSIAQVRTVQNRR